MSRWHNPLYLLAVSLLLPLVSGCVTELNQVRVEPRSAEQEGTSRAMEPAGGPPQTKTTSPPAPVAKEIGLLPYRPAPESPAPTQSAAETPKPVALPKAQRERAPLPASPQGKTDQELLDSAIEFLQAAGDFWEQGDLENALDALDQAYLLTLQVDPEKDPSILQQREDLRFTIAKRIIEIYSSRFTVVNGNRKAIPLVMNEHVQRAIDTFKRGERSFFLNSYRRSGRYRPAILRALREAGLPEELSWLPLIESGFKVQALSRARALGMWQFIATTGYKYGLKRDQWVDERMDPEKATAAAIAYLKDLHQIFGDWTTALASYNCGEGAVLRSIRTQRINYLDNFWDLYTKLPSETAFYVPKFLAVLHILQNPAAHGFDLPPVEEELQADQAVIERAVHLQAVAQQIGIPYETLKDLNPELRHHATPGRPYTLLVPPGKGDLLLARIDDVPVWRPPVASYAVHRVRSGETLSGLAHRYHTSVRAIMALNGLKSDRLIRSGWKLKMPSRGTTAKAEEQDLPTPAPSTRAKALTYEVEKGDSLWKIARDHDTTTQAIASLNQLKTTQLRVGQVLKISEGTISIARMKTRSYRVLKGDSPYVIARRHQMSLSEFLRLNELTPSSTIFPGQDLLVKAD